MRFNRSIYIFAFLLFFIYGKANSIYKIKGKIILAKKPVELKLLRFAAEGDKNKATFIFKSQKIKKKVTSSFPLSTPIISYFCPASFLSFLITQKKSQHSSYFIFPQRGPPSI